MSFYLHVLNVAYIISTPFFLELDLRSRWLVILDYVKLSTELIIVCCSFFKASFRRARDTVWTNDSGIKKYTQHSVHAYVCAVVYFYLYNKQNTCTGMQIFSINRCVWYLRMGFPWWLRWQIICLQRGRPGFNPWVGKIPWRTAWQTIPVFLPGESPWWATVHGVTRSWTQLSS